MGTKMDKVRPVNFVQLNKGDEFFLLNHGKFEPFVKVDDYSAKEVRDDKPVTIDIPKPWKERVFITM